MREIVLPLSWLMQEVKIFPAYPTLRMDLWGGKEGILRFDCEGAKELLGFMLVLQMKP